MALFDDFIADAVPTRARAESSGSAKAVESTTLSDQFTADASGTPKVEGPSKGFLQGQKRDPLERKYLTALNGPAFGFADEILGGIVGGAATLRIPGTKYLDNYHHFRDVARGAMDVEQQESPWQSAGLQMAATLPFGLAMPVERVAAKLLPMAAPYLLPVASKGTQVIGMGGQMARAGASGLLNGSINGVGNSTAESASRNAIDGLLGGAIGSVLGPGLTPVIRGAVGIGSNIAQQVSENSAFKAAQSHIAQAISRDAQGNFFSPAITNPIEAAIAKMRNLGAEAKVADSGGANVRSTLDVLATLPGGTKEAAIHVLENRRNTSANRMINAADDAMGTSGLRLQGTIDDLVDVQRKASAPLYAQVDRHVIDRPSFELHKLVQAADALGATKGAKELAVAYRRPYTLDPSNPSGWKLGDLDILKRSLDQTIGKEWDAVKGKLSERGNAYDNLKTALVKELDRTTTDPKTLTSVYSQARQAFAGPEAMIEAARAGRAAITKPEDAVSKTVKSFSTSEKDAFKVGAMEALRQKLGGSSGGRTQIMGMFENPAMAEKLKLIFNDKKSFEQFADRVSAEKTMKLLQATNTGSQSMARAAAMGDLANPVGAAAGDAATNIATGQPVAAMGSMMKLWKSAQMPEATRDQMGRILLSGGASGEKSLQSMSQLTQHINAERSKMASQAGLLFSQTGNPAALIGSGLLGYTGH